MAWSARIFMIDAPAYFGVRDQEPGTGDASPDA